MRMTKTIVAMTAALAVLVACARNSAPFLLDTFDGTRVAQEVETIAYSTAWDDGTAVSVAVDGVTLKEATAPASGDVVWNAANAGAGSHTLTHTTYKNGVASKVETATFQVGGINPETPDPVNPGTVNPGTVIPDPVTPDPVTPDPTTPGYEVIEATDIVAPYEAPKAVTLQGVVYDGGKVVGIVELKLGKVNAKKGTSKVSGSVTTLDGKKHTVKAFNLMGKYHVQSANVGGDWSKGGTKVYVATSERLAGTLALPEGTIEELLPDGESVIQKNGKWSFAKAASVKWAKPKQGAALPERYDAESGKGLLVDTSGDKTNLSAMKLTLQRNGRDP